MIRVKYYIYTNNIKYVILIPSDSMSFLQGKLRFTMNLQNDLRIMLTYVDICSRPSPAFQVLHQPPVVVSMSSTVEAFVAEAYARTKQWSWYGRDPPPPVPSVPRAEPRWGRPRWPRWPRPRWRWPALEAPPEAPPLPATEPQRQWRSVYSFVARGLQWNFLRLTNFASKPDLPNEVVQETKESESKAWGVHLHHLHHLRLLQLHLHRQLPGRDPFVHLPKLHLHWQV